MIRNQSQAVATPPYCETGLLQNAPPTTPYRLSNRMTNLMSDLRETRLRLAAKTEGFRLMPGPNAQPVARMAEPEQAPIWQEYFSILEGIAEEITDLNAIIDQLDF